MPRTARRDAGAVKSGAQRLAALEVLQNLQPKPATVPEAFPRAAGSSSMRHVQRHLARVAPHTALAVITASWS